MANPEQLISKVGDMMEAQKRIGVTRAHICIHQGKLFVGRRDHCQLRHTVLFVLTSDHFANGLSWLEWENLKSKITIHTKEIRACHEPQEP